MNLFRWIKDKKIIEKEIESQDYQYNSVLIKYGKMEKAYNKSLETIDDLMNKNLERLETISDLRKKLNKLKRETKALKEVMESEQEKITH